MELIFIKNVTKICFEMDKVCYTFLLILED